MWPRERQDGGQRDLFRSRLDQIINPGQALVKLPEKIDWRYLEKQFGVVYDDNPGRPALPTRLMAGLVILKHTQVSSSYRRRFEWVRQHSDPSCRCGRIRPRLVGFGA